MAVLFMIRFSMIYSQKTIESVLYSAAFAITGTIRGTFREKLY